MITQQQTDKALRDQKCPRCKAELPSDRIIDYCEVCESRFYGTEELGKIEGFYSRTGGAQ